MKKTLFIVGLFIYLTYTIANGQNMHSIPSPTAANLGLYGEIPISYYTGTPDISIPLYEIKGKNVNIPITLSYHPSAIRPEIHPGPTGLGWTLQAGGVITRTVRGQGPDESEYDNTNSSKNVSGFLSYTGDGWLSQNNWKRRDEEENSVCENCIKNLNNYQLTDIEPDEFNFFFLDIFGKFYFDHSGSIQVQSDRAIQVQFNNEFFNFEETGFDYTYISRRIIKSFIIIDEQGNRYHFGGGNAIEFSDPISYGIQRSPNGTLCREPATGAYFQATSWFLTKIESADGVDIITFDYERGPFISQLYRSINSLTDYESAEFKTNELTLSGVFICPVYLTKISKKNGETILFKLNRSNDLSYKTEDYLNVFDESSCTGGTYRFQLLWKYTAIPRLKQLPVDNNYLNYIQWLKFDNISISDSSGHSLRNVEFNYIENPKERLFLENVRIYNSKATDYLRYDFSYKNRERLLPYLECFTDHVGFNNGQKVDDGFYISRKMPNLAYTDSGVLSSIHYPTGGYTHFEYELHDYSIVVNTKNREDRQQQSGILGGIRIKKIITNDLRKEVTRDFFYRRTLSSTTSSGVLNVLPTYSYDFIGKYCHDEKFNRVYISSYPFIPLTSENDGRFIGYTTVFERISNENNGYTQYVYTNHDNGHHDVLLQNGLWNRDAFPKDPHNSRFFERGRLLKKIHYNDKSIPIWEQHTHWDRYGSQGEENPRALHLEGVQTNFGYVCSSAAYLQYTYKFLPFEKKEISYDINGQNPITTITNYTYNTDKLLQSETIITSNGTQLTTKYNYTKDILHRSGVERSAYQWLVNNHIIGTPIEQLTYKNGQLINASFVNYKTFQDIPATWKVYPSEVLQLETDKPLMNYNYNNSGIDTRLKPQLYYDRYDEKGNVLQARKADGITVSYLWGYNKLYPIAEIVGATYDEAVSALDENDLQIISGNSASDEELRTKIQLLRTNLPQAMITSYTHRPLVGMTSKTDPNGITTYYEYDNANRLKIVRDHEGNVLKQYEYHYHQNE